MLERLAYFLNRRFPLAFAPVRLISGQLARLVHAKSITLALATAEISQEEDGTSRTLRSLHSNDVDTLWQFLQRQPEGRFSYFRPHGFDRPALRRHLRAGQFLSYGLFEGRVMIAYGLIRLTPGRSTFIGSMVSESHAGRGVGKLMARYLYWQAAEMNLDVYLTISDDNPASLSSHSPDRRLEKVQSLDDAGYSLYRAPRVGSDDNPPQIEYGTKSASAGPAHE